MPIGGCSVLSLDGLVGNDAGTAAFDSSTPPDSPEAQDAASDTRTPSADVSSSRDAPQATGDAGMAEGSAPANPVTVVSVGSVAAPSGHAQQGPLVWLSGARAWWLFYVDGSAPTTLAALGSSDFQKWSPVGSFSLPGPVVDGRDLAAFAGAAGGTDVVHLGASVAVASNDRRHLHARVHPASGMLQLDAYSVLGTTTMAATQLDPDGPATVLGTDDTVLDTSAWYTDPDSGATGNEYAWLTSSPDPGGAWTPPWGGATTVGMVAQYVNAREAVPLAGGGCFALWEAGDTEPDPSNVRFAVRSSGQWSAAGDVFLASTQDPNDWGACLLGTSIHAIRHTSAGAWQHRVWSGSSFADGGAIPPLDSPAGTGVVALCDGAHVRVFAIAPDAGSPVNETRWDGKAWSPWTEVVAPGGKRSWLSGTISPSGQVALVWTETADAGAVVAGALVPN